MGTRSLTYIYDGKIKTKAPALVCFYRQFDGYPSGLGSELAEFLKDMRICNGFSSGQDKGWANGAGCLAAQIIAHFKTGIGNIYLYAPKAKIDAGQEYTYRIYVDASVTLSVSDYTGKTFFAGTPTEFLAALEKGKLQ